MRMTTSACQKWPRTRFHERFRASVPRRFSTMSAGSLTDRNTRKMIPGMMSRMNPTPTTIPTRTATRSTLPKRLRPHR